MLKSVILDFDVHHGSSKGLDIGKGFILVFESYDFNLLQVICVLTDTTGDMNTFGRFLKAKGITHLYCVGHNINLTARLYSQDINLPGSESVMSSARKLI